MQYNFTLELKAGPIWLCELECTAHYAGDWNGRYLDHIEAHDNGGQSAPLIVRNGGNYQHIWDQSVAHLDGSQAQIDEAWDYFSPRPDSNDEHRLRIWEVV